MNPTHNELIEAVATVQDERDRALHDLRAVQRKLLEMNEHMEQAEMCRSHFLSNIRNQVNSPISSLIGLSAILQGTRAPDAGEVRKIARVIQCEVLDLDFDMRNMLAAAEMEAGDAVLAARRIEVRPFLANCIESLAHKAEEKGVPVHVSAGFPEAVVQDPEKVSLIATNLLRNAVEYSRPGGEVWLSLEKDGENLRIVVRDEGEGMPPDAVPYVFDRFFQAAQGTARSHRGSGLGLSVVKAAVELMEGRISLESAAGRGTAVTVVLPETAVDAKGESRFGNDLLIEEADGEERLV